jgi:hypothetical protein
VFRWQSKAIFCAAFVIASLFLTCQNAWCQQYKKIVDNGDDGSRLVFAILGDGYAQSDQAKYEADVDRIIVNGLLGHDFYQRFQKAFNVYRVDTWSKDSGMSHPNDPKKTAMDCTVTGQWSDCWITTGANTDTAIAWALKPLAKYDYVLVLCNDSQYGGCCRSGRLFVTSGSPWSVGSHEYGHGIGRLFDEYIRQGTTYSGSPVNFLNCSTFPDRRKIAWSKQLLGGTPVPTYLGQIPANGVGVYEGGNCYEKGIYRPAYDCKMNSNTPPFCPVCESLMEVAVKPYYPKPTQGFDMRQIQRFLHFDFKINESGKWGLDRFKESTGFLITKQEYPSSDFIVESYTSGGNRDAQFVGQDPFTVRCYPKPGTKLERVHKVKDGHFTVGIPKMTRGEAAEQKLGLRLYQLKSGVQIRRIDVPSLQTLKARKSVILKTDMKPDRLLAAIRQYMNR